MSHFSRSRRDFLKAAGATTGVALLPGTLPGVSADGYRQAKAPSPESADYTLTIATKPLEVAPNRILSVTTYNGQFPGPLLRFKEGQQVTVDVHNQTDTPEQLHWHGQFVSPEVDGAGEEGTPFIPPHGNRRISFVPKPSGFRFYHTHVRAGSDLSAGQYSGLVGPVYIEPRNHPGDYDREVFLTLKEFQPTLSRGGDMAMDFLSPPESVASLKDQGESRMKASLAKGMPHGYEVGYDSFTINGRMLGHGDPIRVKPGRARLVSRAQRQCDRDSQPGPAGTQLSRGRDGWQSAPKACARTGSVAGNRRAHISHRRDEPSRRLGPGRSG